MNSWCASRFIFIRLVLAASEKWSITCFKKGTISTLEIKRVALLLSTFRRSRSWLTKRTILLAFLRTTSTSSAPSADSFSLRDNWSIGFKISVSGVLISWETLVKKFSLRAAIRCSTAILFLSLIIANAVRCTNASNATVTMKYNR